MMSVIAIFRQLRALGEPFHRKWGLNSVEETAFVAGLADTGVLSMSRARTLALRFVVIALVIVAAFWGLLQTYAQYKAHRAKSLLAEASRVQVGDTEESVLALSSRYDGFKWTPEPLPPREQWIDKDEYDYQLNLQCDYKYELGISPFGISVASPASRWTQILRAARERVPEHLRPLLGLRDWGTTVELSIRRGRVQSVSAMTLVEGRSQWVGHSWELAERMPRSHMPARAYSIGAAHLTMADGGGEMVQNFFTPTASKQEMKAARKFDARCLTSLRGCGLCDVSPRALEYLKNHPDAAWNIIPPKCP
jgi:hypothetical protein